MYQLPVDPQRNHQSPDVSVWCTGPLNESTAVHRSSRRTWWSPPQVTHLEDHPTDRKWLVTGVKTCYNGYNGYNGYNPCVNGVYFSFSILKHLCVEVSDFLLERCFCRQIHEMNTVRIGQCCLCKTGMASHPFQNFRPQEFSMFDAKTLGLPRNRDGIND